MAKAPAKTASKPAAPKATAAPAAAAVKDAAQGSDSVHAGGRTREDVVHFCYDNDHKDGVHCTLTFADGATSEAIVPKTSSLAADQAAASAAALESAA